MNDDLHTLSGAYAVHALPYAEWVLFEEHLLACHGCGEEVRRLRETAARLAEAVAEPPPAGLRERLLAAAHRKARPVADDAPTVWRSPHAPTTAWTIDPPTLNTPAGPPQGPENDPPTLSLPAGLPREFQGDPPALSLPAGFPERSGGEVVALRRRRGRVLAGLAAVCAAAAVALGVVAFDARRDLGDLRGRNGEMLAVLAAPDAETVRLPITSGGTGTLVVSRARGLMVFTSSGLPDLPATRGYELWLMGPDGTRPAGMLDRADGGLTAPMVAAPQREDERVALTVEPATGSDRPTTQPILLTEIPQT
jgi:hypothetical protein